MHYRNHYLQCSKDHNSKGRLNRVRVFMFCILSHNALQLCEFLSKYLKWFPTYRADMRSRKNLPFSVYKSELRFMCSAFSLMVHYICVKFCENITNSIRVIKQTPVHGRNSYFQFL